MEGTPEYEWKEYGIKVFDNWEEKKYSFMKDGKEIATIHYDSIEEETRVQPERCRSVVVEEMIFNKVEDLT